MSSRPGEFRPPAWLAHPHVQSIFPSLPFRRPGVERRCAALLSASVDEILDCGEGVRLLSHHATHERIGREPVPRLVVLLHGWEGSANSLDVLSLGQYPFDRGFDVVRRILRDHGDSHHLNPGIFHSCRIAEVGGADNARGLPTACCILRRCPRAVPPCAPPFADCSLPQPCWRLPGRCRPANSSTCH